MIAFPSFSRYTQSMVAIVVIIFVVVILVLFQQTKHRPSCPSSSCGKIHNITYPFRLKGDPGGCGLSGYELDCVNNVTMLTLFSGKYHVQDINYKRYQIRLTDAGVVEDTACSIPRYFLYYGKFSFVSIPDYTTTDSLTLGYTGEVYQYWSQSIGVLNCTNPVTDDPRYVEVDTGCDSGGHIYAVMGTYFTMGDIKVGCHLKVATFASERLSGSDNGSVSYADIHKRLLDGFWLSWLLPVTCKDHCGKGIKCSLNETTSQVECDPQRYCHYVYHTTTKCGILSQVLGYTRGYLKGIIIGLLSRVTFSTKQLNNPVGQQYFNEAVFIGRNILSVFITARYLFGVALLLALLIYKWWRRHLSMYENIENFLLDNNLNPIRYEYREIKKMVGGFKVKLGQGGFGSVYKGKLRSGPDVAIRC
ncbi:serine/threonine-protein kinase [Spatholobus suberectus]|nr:serine/threonine-protein kinase [Spatholobus suberectus]